MNFEAQVTAISAACAHLDRTAATAASRALIDEIRERRVIAPAMTTMPVLRALRRKRWFEEVLQIAEVVIEAGFATMGVRLQHAQALIDLGHLAAARALLEQLRDDVVPRSHAESEVRGLLGRVYKQLYVNGAGGDELRAERIVRSFNAYFDAYRENSELAWHGINAVAVFARAKRDCVSIQAACPDARALLELALRCDDVWSHAIAGEAAIALGDFDLAYHHYKIYANDEVNTDAFEIGNALRQLVEVWQLTDDDEPGARLLPLLRGALLRRLGGLIELHGKTIRSDLEKNFGTDAPQSLNWYRQGLDRCLSVCCVRHERGDAWGTGFIVRGADFGFADDLLLLTNEHVLSATCADALRPGRTYVKFDALPERAAAKCVEIVWSNRALDATLARFDPPLAGVNAISIDDDLDLPDPQDATARVYVIGHPHGGGLALSMHDNLLSGWDEDRVHYRAPTEHGSSGSPVFDDQWRIIALHHGGGRLQRLDGSGEFHDANEGFRIDRIRNASLSSRA
ncbi:MAG: trypsin-like peptidase domain-containing protein [Thermoanaerobaculia bacterium]